MPLQSPARRQVLVLAADGFGHDLAARLATDPDLVVDVEDVGAGTHPAQWTYADVTILATGSERPWIAEALDRAAHVRAMPWFAVFARPTEIQCGPVVRPGRTACLACYRNRRAQHDRSPHPADPMAAPPRVPGTVRHHVAIAEALTRRALAEILEPDDGPGATVTTVGLVGGQLSQHRTVSVDGCPRCGGRFGSTEEHRHGFRSAMAGLVPATVTAGSPR